MNILIVGCGMVGSTLARSLEQLGHDISVLDPKEENLQSLYDFGHSGFHGTALAGVPIDVDVLRSAGIESCDAVLAVTPDDTINIMVAQVAQEVCGVKKVVARIYDPSLKDVFADQFSITTISPTNLTVQSVLSSLFDNAQAQHVTFGSTTFSFKKMPIAKKYIGRNLGEIPAEDGYMIFGVIHKTGITVMAAPQLELEEGDMLIISYPVD
ncbi:MAG: TrkA family potassium uptake protein [Oscillospiraceae bacterium]|nr:TrkA family potassium uptake protein [Oscillospiraceae bacterium]